MNVSIFLLIMIWASPILSQLSESGCYSPGSSSSMSDADLLCQNIKMNKENSYMLKNISTDDVEVISLVTVEIDLDKNFFTKFKDLKGILMYKCQVNTFQPESSKLVNLQVYCTSFPNNSNFDNCCKNLNKLGLRNNTGLDLEKSIFTKLTRLTQLRLSLTPVEHLTKDIVKGLSSLKILRLSQLGIKRIDSDAFVDLPKLREMSIEDHEMEEINTDIFKTLRNIKVLTIYANKLKAIPLEALREMRQLRDLGLPLQSWKEMDIEMIPRVLPKLSSYSYTEEWEAEDAHIYEPLFRRLSAVLMNKN